MIICVLDLKLTLDKVSLYLADLTMCILKPSLKFMLCLTYILIYVWSLNIYMPFWTQNELKIGLNFTKLT